MKFKLIVALIFPLCSFSQNLDLKKIFGNNDPIETAHYLKEKNFTKQELENLLKITQTKKFPKHYYCKKDLIEMSLGASGMLCAFWTGILHRCALRTFNPDLTTWDIIFLRVLSIQASMIFFSICSIKLAKGLFKAETRAMKKNNTVVQEILKEELDKFAMES